MRDSEAKKAARRVGALGGRRTRGTLHTTIAAIVLVAGSVLWPTLAQGQGPRGPRGGGGFGPEPKWFGSIDGGYQWSNLVGDPETASVWDLDSNWSLRLTVKRSIAPRTSIGLGYMYTRLPVGIIPRSADSPCQQRCVGDVTVARYGVVAHSGGGPGLHLVYEGFVGAAQYGNFSLTGTGSSAFSGLKNTDLAWSIGAGAGYGLSNDFALTAIFDYGSSLHEKSNDLFQRRTTQHNMIRFGVRVGL